MHIQSHTYIHVHVFIYVLHTPTDIYGRYVSTPACLMSVYGSAVCVYVHYMSVRVCWCVYCTIGKPLRLSQLCVPDSLGSSALLCSVSSALHFIMANDSVHIIGEQSLISPIILATSMAQW